MSRFKKNKKKNKTPHTQSEEIKGITQQRDKFRVLQSDQQADKNYMHTYIHAYMHTTPLVLKRKRKRRVHERDYDLSHV